MKHTWPRSFSACALVFCSLAAPIAHAQYSWIDDKGTRVFSDRPPPPGTPPARILKMPRGLAPRAPTPETAPAAGAAPAQAAAPAAPAALSLAERDAEFRKRAAKQEAEEKKAQQEAANKAAKDENCEIARESERALSSGVRVSKLDANGEKVVLSDEERAHRLERAQKVLKSCK